MAETNALLKRHTGNRIEGSNPSVSASITYLDARLAARQAQYPSTKPFTGCRRVLMANGAKHGIVQGPILRCGARIVPKLHRTCRADDTQAIEMAGPLPIM